MRRTEQHRLPPEEPASRLAGCRESPRLPQGPGSLSPALRGAGLRGLRGAPATACRSLSPCLPGLLPGVLPWPFTPFLIPTMTAGFGLFHRTRMEVSPVSRGKKKILQHHSSSLSFYLPSCPFTKVIIGDHSQVIHLFIHSINILEPSSGLGQDGPKLSFKKKQKQKTLQLNPQLTPT